MVRKTVKHHDSSDDREYYVETKSGKRERIEELLLTTPQLRAMDIFDKITDRFPHVEIVEEIKELSAPR